MAKQGLLQRFEKTQEFLGESQWSEVGPLHATSQQTPFLSLLARVEDFTEEWGELVKQNQAVPVSKGAEQWPRKHYSRSRCMRGTLHMLPAHAEPFVNACYEGKAEIALAQFGVDVETQEFADWSATLLEQLYNAAAKDAGKGKGKRQGKSDTAGPSGCPSPATAVHLRDKFMPKGSGERKCPIFKASKKDQLRKWGSGCRMKWMLQWLWSKGMVEHGAIEPVAEATMKHWRSTRRTWSISGKGAQLLVTGDATERAKEVVDSLLEENKQGEARLEAELDLCIWYFSLYGPATFKDYQWWSGLSPVVRLRRPFDMLKEGIERPSMQTPHGTHFKLVQVDIEGMEEELFMMESQLPSLLATSGAPIAGMVRLLPYEDAIIKAYKETRYRFYPQYRYGSIQEAKRSSTSVSTRSGKGCRKTRASSPQSQLEAPDTSKFREPTVIVRGEAMPSVWLDGCIAGVWKWRNKPQQPLAVTMMVEPSKQQRRLLDAELERVAVLVQQSEVVWL